MNSEFHDGAVDDLRKFLQPHSPSVLAPETDLLEQGVIDSLMMMDLVAHLEGTYGIRLSAEDVVPRQFRSIAALAELAATKLRNAERAA